MPFVSFGSLLSCCFKPGDRQDARCEEKSVYEADIADENVEDKSMIIDNLSDVVEMVQELTATTQVIPNAKQSSPDWKCQNDPKENSLTENTISDKKNPFSELYDVDELNYANTQYIHRLPSETKADCLPVKPVNEKPKTTVVNLSAQTTDTHEKTDLDTQMALQNGRKVLMVPKNEYLTLSEYLHEKLLMDMIHDDKKKEKKKQKATGKSAFQQNTYAQYRSYDDCDDDDDDDDDESDTNDPYDTSLYRRYGLASRIQSKSKSKKKADKKR
jgi:hypothetical protein